jgi:hypothetical protein
MRDDLLADINSQLQGIHRLQLQERFLKHTAFAYTFYIYSIVTNMTTARQWFG